MAKEEEKHVPVFFSILNGKDKQTYEEMFKIINEVSKNGLCNKQYIMGDFEINNFQFLRKYNAKIQTKFCFFHYSQCLFRKYKSIKQCSSELVYGLKTLAVAPKDRIFDIFHLLQNKYYQEYNGEEKEGNGQMIKYFIDNYLIGYEGWNVSDFKDRTNNVCESLNKDMKSFFKRQRLYDYRKNIELSKKLLCRYIEERREANKNKTKVRLNKYLLKNKIIESINENQKYIECEILLKMLLIVNRKKYSCHMEKELEEVYVSTKDKKLVPIYNDLVQFKFLLSIEGKGYKITKQNKVTQGEKYQTNNSEDDSDEEDSSDSSEEDDSFDSDQEDTCLDEINAEEKKPKRKEHKE